MRSKSFIMILVAALAIVLGVVGFLLGIILSGDKQNKDSQTVATESRNPVTSGIQTISEIQITSESNTTVTKETTEAATTVTTAAKPTIAKAYLYYINTGAGFKLYMHVEGDYANYQYQLYSQTPGHSGYSISDFQGENSVEEFLISEGLGGTGIETYKADLTAWNRDKSQFVQQWAYVDIAKSDDGSKLQQAVTESASKTYLFGGYVATKNDDLNMRNQPNQSSKVVAKIPRGMQLMIYSSGTEGWYWTEYDGKSGYVSAQYIREIEPYDPGINPDFAQAYVYSCNLTGVIRTNGEIVPGFTTSYVCDGGTKSMVRTSLGDGWHIESKKYCYSMNTTWYELYDAWDGDYYGWVAESYIAFDP